MRIRKLIAGAAITIGSLLPMQAATAAPQVQAPTVMATTGWINVSSSQGSYNCVIWSRQVSSYLWETKVVSGVCNNLWIETYRYNSQYMCDLDGRGFRMPIGYVNQSRCSLKICYTYLYWRDGAGVFRDVLFMDGGGQA